MTSLVSTDFETLRYEVSDGLARLTLDRPESMNGMTNRMVREARDVKRDTGIFAWPLNPLVRTFGLLLQESLVWPLVTLFYRVRVHGREHLHQIDRPVFFAPNHCLHWDNGIILTSIPIGWRWKLAIAAAADDVFGNKLNGFASAVLADAFPMAREGAIRHSLELLGARLDRNFSVLIYPEGKLTDGLWFLANVAFGAGGLPSPNAYAPTNEFTGYGSLLFDTAFLLQPFWGLWLGRALLRPPGPRVPAPGPRI